MPQKWHCMAFHVIYGGLILNPDQDHFSSLKDQVWSHTCKHLIPRSFKRKSSGVATFICVIGEIIQMYEK